MVLNKTFYSRPTLAVAKDLLGCTLVRKIGRQEIRAIITETEAYIGEDDLACHAAKGRTPRTEMLYGEASYAYVYLIYGMYHCLNVVTEKKNFPAAVLIRAVKIPGAEYAKTNGPGKLCRLMKIDREFHGNDLTKKQTLWLEKASPEIAPKFIKADKRIGIDYAQHCREYRWRFSIDPDIIGKK